MKVEVPACTEPAAGSCASVRAAVGLELGKANAGGVRLGAKVTLGINDGLAGIFGHLAVQRIRVRILCGRRFCHFNRNF